MEKFLNPMLPFQRTILSKKKISSLNDVVNMYLDYAESQAKRNRLMSMSDWIDRLDAFLKFNEYDVLNSPGKVKREVADQLAISEYGKFRIIQNERFISDFDKESKRLLKE